MSGMLDRFMIVCLPTTGSIYLAKMGAKSGEPIATRDVDGEVLLALVDSLLLDLAPGVGAARYIRVTRPGGEPACYDLRLEPIDAATFEGEL